MYATIACLPGRPQIIDDGSLLEAAPTWLAIFRHVSCEVISGIWINLVSFSPSQGTVMTLFRYASVGRAGSFAGMLCVRRPRTQDAKKESVISMITERHRLLQTTHSWNSERCFEIQSQLLCHGSTPKAYYGMKGCKDKIGEH